MKIKSVLIIVLCLVSLVSCASTRTGDDYEIPIDSDFTENPDNWEIKAYVDQFRLPTDNKYVVSWAIAGFFSNSATKGSECTAKLLINYEGEVEIVIYEYGKYLADAYSSESYTYTMENTETREIVSKGYATLTDRFTIDDEEATEIIDNLCKGGNYLFTIAGGKYTTSIYVISFDGSGCAAALKELFPVMEEASEQKD